MNIIEINGLTKSYGNILAVSDLSFAVGAGALFAFLGENGAGKSTTINIICGQLNKDDGEVIIDGKNIDSEKDEIKRELGVVFQNSLLDSHLSVYDNLECRAALYGVVGADFKKRLIELVEMLDFKDFLYRPVGKLSGGQRRRIDIARALIHKPRILILDEPTTGLDPQTRRMLWDLILKLQREEGVTVLLTTHYMEEAAEADYVVVIDEGKLVAKGTPLELKKAYTGDYLTIYGISEDEVKKFGYDYVVLKGAYKITIPGPVVASKLISENTKLFYDFELTKGNMDDVFLAITGKKLNGGEEK